MKILAAGDIHSDKDLAKRLANKAEKEQVDLIILNGDIVEENQTEGILGAFKNKKLVILPGNHEILATTDFLAELYGVKNLHGYSVIYNDIGFFGAGGADIGPGAVSESELFETLKKAHSGLKNVKTKIMVTHQHPKGSKSEFSGIEGSLAIKKALEEFKPDLLIHGHIHEAEGIEEKIGKTKVINVGRKGKIIEI